MSDTSISPETKASKSVSGGSGSKNKSPTKVCLISVLSVCQCKDLLFSRWRTERCPPPRYRPDTWQPPSLPSLGMRERKPPNLLGEPRPPFAPSFVNDVWSVPGPPWRKRLQRRPVVVRRRPVLLPPTTRSPSPTSPWTPPASPRSRTPGRRPTWTRQSSAPQPWR